MDRRQSSLNLWTVRLATLAAVIFSGLLWQTETKARLKIPSGLLAVQVRILQLFNFQTPPTADEATTDWQTLPRVEIQSVCNPRHP
jgi:hypothetical protein